MVVNLKKHRLFALGVKSFIQNSDITQKQVAKAIDLTPGNFSSYLNSRTKIPDRVVTKLINFLGKSYEYFQELGSEKEKEEEFFLSPNIRVADLVQALSRYVESDVHSSSNTDAHSLHLAFSEPPPTVIHTQDTDKQKNFDEDHFIAVPVYESQKPAMGNHGLESDQTQKAASYIIIFRPELKHRVKHRLIAFRVRDDAMAPLIPQDSIIVVDTDDREFVDNKIFGIALNEKDEKDEKDEKPEYSITAKRVRKLKETSGFLLLSENQDHSPKQMEEAAWGKQCIGRVVWMWRSFDD